jgi:hypothetical protein
MSPDLFDQGFVGSLSRPKLSSLEPISSWSAYSLEGHFTEPRAHESLEAGLQTVSTWRLEHEVLRRRCEHSIRLAGTAVLRLSAGPARWYSLIPARVGAMFS